MHKARYHTASIIHKNPLITLSELTSGLPFMNIITGDDEIRDCNLKNKITGILVRTKKQQQQQKEKENEFNTQFLICGET